MPNTFTMQEWMRGCFDSYVEELGNSQLSNLVVLRIPKGANLEAYGMKLIDTYPRHLNTNLSSALSGVFNPIFYPIFVPHTIKKYIL